MTDKYAIIQLQGKQYQVKVGDQLAVDLLPKAEGEEFKITDVLLLHTDKEVKIGTPLVAKASVSAKLINHKRGEKIRVATYKAKSRYRKVKGHRQELSTIEITKIG